MTNAFVTRFLTANAIFSGFLRWMRDLYASSCKRNVLRWVLSPKVPLYQREDKDRNVSALYFHFQEQHTADISEGKWANKKFILFFNGFDWSPLRALYSHKPEVYQIRTFQGTKYDLCWGVKSMLSGDCETENWETMNHMDCSPQLDLLLSLRLWFVESICETVGSN